MPDPIRFNHPSLAGRELDLVAASVEDGHTSSSGPFSTKVSALLTEAHGAADVLMTTSCTDALEMSAMLLDPQPGDTVIVPSFTFVSTALAYVREGFDIVFADIEPHTLAIDPGHVAELVDDTTRAVLAVHYAGIAADLDGLDSVLSGTGIDLIEDNAHGLFGSHRDRPLGSFGRFATLSFHETKNFVCGEGGALIVNREADVDRAHVIHDKGTDRRAFMLGHVDKYSWRDIGSSFGLSDMNAAFLLGQLEQRETIMAKRRRVFDLYDSILRPAAPDLGLQLPALAEGSECGYHMYFVLLPDRETRDMVLRRLREVDIHSTFHYVPLHSSDGGRRFASRRTECPITDDISGRLIRLPFHNRLPDGDVERTATTFLEILGAS